MDAQPHPVEVTLLGPIQVARRDGTRGTLIGERPRRLVAALALARGPVSVNALVDDLWEDEPPTNPKAAIQTLISRLRPLLPEGFLTLTPAGYMLGSDGRPAHSDLARAEGDLHAATALAAHGETEAATRRAEAGLALWTGIPGSDLGDGELTDALRRHAATVREGLGRLRVDGLIALGRAAEAVAVLTEFCRSAPLDEALHLALARAQRAAGNRSGALQTFARFRSALGDALGVSPSAAFVALNADLLRDDPQGAPGVIAAPSNAPSNTPAPTHTSRGIRRATEPLIGRDDDLAALTALVSTHRLTTVLGPGGLGKTSIAHAVAAAAEPHTPAIVVTELASISSADDIALVLASALGIREATAGTRLSDAGVRVDLHTRIVTALGERPTLLLIDNCEHLIDGAAEWVQGLLESVPDLHVLATSRAPLDIPGEAAYELAPLPTHTDAGVGPAVELFLARARSVRPSATLPLDTVTRLCEHLDGLPLAIELAAARIRSLSVHDIEQRLGDRFALLNGGSRRSPERHRTLQAVIEWSWNLLSELERDVLARVSLFVDGLSGEAAAAVVGANADEQIDALIQQSLLRVVEPPGSLTVRYRMLETIREFGERALVASGNAEEVRERMLDWARDWSIHVAPRTDGAGQVAAFRSIEAEQENLVSSLRSALDRNRPDAAVEIFALLFLFWARRGTQTEVMAFAPDVERATRGYDIPAEHANAAGYCLAIAAITQVYGNLREAVVVRARLRDLCASGLVTDTRLLAVNRLLSMIGSLTRTEAVLRDLRADPDPHLATIVLLMSAQGAENGGDPDAAIEFSHRAYEHGVAAHDLWAQSFSALSLAQYFSQTARPREAVRWSEKARAGLLELRADEDLRQLDWMIAINEGALGITDRALGIYTEFVTTDSPQGANIEYQSIGRTGLAELHLAAGREDEGLADYRRGVEVFVRPADRSSPWCMLTLSGCLAAHAYADRSDDESLMRYWLDRVRYRLVAVYRRLSYFSDRPVAGSVATGVAVYALHRPATRTLGVEALALAEYLSSRQDQYSLNRARLWAYAATVLPAATLEAARHAAEAMSMTDRVARLMDLMLDPLWRSLPTA